MKKVLFPLIYVLILAVSFSSCKKDRQDIDDTKDQDIKSEIAISADFWFQDDSRVDFRYKVNPNIPASLQSFVALDKETGLYSMKVVGSVNIKDKNYLISFIGVIEGTGEYTIYDESEESETFVSAILTVTESNGLPSIYTNSYEYSDFKLTISSLSNDRIKANFSGNLINMGTEESVELKNGIINMPYSKVDN